MHLVIPFIFFRADKSACNISTMLVSFLYVDGTGKAREVAANTLAEVKQLRNLNTSVTLMKQETKDVRMKAVTAQELMKHLPERQMRQNKKGYNSLKI